MTKKHKSNTSIVGEISVVLLGAVLFSMSMNMFLLPAGIVLGGMTGISTVLNMFFGTPVGLTIIILNIPLIIANTYFFGKHFLGRTIIGLAATSLSVDLFMFFPVPEVDPLICAILGGACMGAGTGALISRGYTTGGTDLVACLVKLKWRGISTGSIIMLCDLVIILGAAFFTRSLDGLFYSIICTWSAGKVLDMMISGSQRAGQAFVVTDKAEELTKLIFEKLDRGVTVLEAVGGYTGKPKRVLMCVVARRQIFLLKQLAAECDGNSFVIIADASEVSGRGFANRAAGNMIPRRKGRVR